VDDFLEGANGRESCQSMQSHPRPFVDSPGSRRVGDSF